MNWTRTIALLLLNLNLLKGSEDGTEKYSEIATITYLPNFNLLTDVVFTLSKEFPRDFDSGEDGDKNLGHFPNLIYSLPTEFGLQEGKISFTRGRWDWKLWGKAPNNPASSGFQFHGHFKNQFKKLSIEKRFNQAVGIISGYFCASLNVLKYSNAIKPTIPTFPSKIITDTPLSVIAGIIPHEPVCIENLEPWLDLLPCSKYAGLAQMFKPEAIYQSNFHSIEVEFFTTETRMEIKLRMITVYDLNRWDRNRNWSLTGLFGNKFIKSCPLFHNDPKVILQIPNEPEFLESLLQHKDKVSSAGKYLNVEYTGDDLVNEIGATVMPNFPTFINHANPFRAYRFKSGVNDDIGGIGLALENDLTTSIEVTVIESIPWLFRVFLHQGEFALNSKPIPQSSISKYLKSFSIEPSILRKRNLLLQSKWIVPPQSKLQIYFPFEREFLRIDEFPPNSERGIELPGALIFYNDSDVYETTNTLLYTWPIPDATMPFNVITMTSTLAALFYGTFFNLIFRRYYLKLPNDPPPGILPKIIWEIKSKIKK